MKLFSSASLPELSARRLMPKAAGDRLHLVVNWVNTPLCRMGRVIFEAVPQRLEIQQGREGCLIDAVSWYLR